MLKTRNILVITTIVVLSIGYFMLKSYINTRNSENMKICFNSVTQFNGKDSKKRFLLELSKYKPVAGDDNIPFKEDSAVAIKYYPSQEDNTCYLLFINKDVDGTVPATMNESDTGAYTLYSIPNVRFLRSPFTQTEAEKFYYAIKEREENSKKQSIPPKDIGIIFERLFERYLP